MAYDKQRQPGARTLLGALVLLLVGVGAYLLLTEPFALPTYDFSEWVRYCRTGGVQAAFCFVALATLLIWVGAPRLLLCGLAGLAFGFWQGLFCSLVASMAGSFLAFQAVRCGNRAWLAPRLREHRLGARLAQSRPGVAGVALLRLLPVNNGIVNLGLALGQVDNRSFLLGSLLGFLPHGAAAALLTSGTASAAPYAHALQIGAAGAALLGLTWWAWRRRPAVRVNQAGGASAPLGRL